jgi:5-methylcytosine-specific restriction endonuclease McrA
MKLLTLCKIYDYTCYWCHKKFDIEDLSRDHIKPKNGKPSLSGKCVLSCIFCNQKRGNKDFDYFREELVKERKMQKDIFNENMKRLEKIEKRLLSK